MYHRAGLYNVSGPAAVVCSAVGRGLVRVLSPVVSFVVRLICSGRPRIKKSAGSAWFNPGCIPNKTGARFRQMSGLGAALILAVLLPSAAQAVPAGTNITNTAGANYTFNGNPRTTNSNTVDIITVELRFPSVLELFRYAPSSPSVSLTVGITPYFDGGGFIPAPAPSDPASGTTINLTVPVPLEPAVNFSQGDPVFIRLTDLDVNTDPAIADTIVLTIDDPGSGTIETLLLSETGTDTGAFTGYIRSGATSESTEDGILYGFPGAQFSGEYVDPGDPTDTSSELFLFDAEGVLWITASPGKPVVSVGDYLTYTVTVENNSGATVPGTILTTDLPTGFRYEVGSTKVDSFASPDPIVAPDGRSLAFSIGDVSPAQTVTINFVTRVGAGVRPGKAVTPNLASSGILLSNTAMATVRVTEDLFRSHNVIMGQVLSGSCGDEAAIGVPGIRIFLEDGTYVVTDEMGRYHFEGVKSGTHVVQMDIETIPEMYEFAVCDEDTRQAGRPWSRFVDLAGGSLWRVNFNLIPKPPSKGRTVLILKTEAGPDRATFNATMMGDHIPLRNVRFSVSLPEGVEYRTGSAMLDGVTIEDPEITGSTLVWNVGHVPGAWEKGITFETKITHRWKQPGEGDFKDLDPGDGATKVKLVQGEMSEVVSSARIMFDTPLQKDISSQPVENILLKVAEREETRTKKFVFRPHFETFEARLTKEDRQALDIISKLFDPAQIGQVQVVGHTDNVPISDRGKRLYADNYELSKARARAMARYLRAAWDIPSSLFIIEGKGPDEPLAKNETARGRTLNRRVEVKVITTTVETRTELEPISDQSTTRMAIEGLRPGQKDPLFTDLDSTVEPQKVMIDPLKDFAWFEDANGRFEWIWPDSGYSPAVPVTKVAVKHKPGSRLVLTVNGVEADPLSFEGTTLNHRKRSALSVWRGVRLSEGVNRFKVVQYWKDGRKLGAIERSVYLAGRPVKVSVVPDQSNLTADGQSPPQVAVRLTDRNGEPARPGLVGRYFVESPYEIWNKAGEKSDETRDPGTTSGQFLIGTDGIARLYLEPTVQSGEAVLKVGVQGAEEEIRVWLTAQRNQWILVGLAEGTAGYSTVSGNAESLEDSGGEEELYTDGRAVFFAKGRIKGEYLLTMQYDSAGPHGAAGEGLYGNIDPDTYYTLYGDSTEQDYEAPTSKKLYLKIERKQFYALFGDTDTGLTVTELSRYDRRITGLRSEARGEGFSYNFFAAETRQGFVRDEIPGDGTSGPYKLSNSDVVINSESVRIEVRDRFQSHVIVTTQEMVRHIDYNIDYGEGTLFFKSPVSERDTGFNPVYIVADYETSDPDATGITYGARLEAPIPGSDITVGLSHIHEDKGGGEGNLAGLDIKAGLSEHVTVKAEAASTSNETFGTESDGTAYILELIHDSGDLTGKAYLRKQEEEFGLGHQNKSEGGNRKIGADGQYHISDDLSLIGEVFRQENLKTGAERQVEEVGASLNSGNTTYLTSIRQATDTDSDDSIERSQQLTAGLRWHSDDNRWNLSADHEHSVGDNDNTDYPTRTLLGADYSLTSNVSIYAEQEFTEGESTSVNSTRMGMNARPWDGGTVSSEINRKSDESGERVYAATGLNQTWQVSEKWKVSAGIEKADILKENSSEPLNENTPSSSAGENYTAVSVGAGYTLDKWDFDIRLEARDSDSGDKWGLISGLFGEPRDGIGISTDLKHFITEADSGLETTQTDIKLGFVYRPFTRKWTFLDRLDYSIDEEKDGTPGLRAWKIVNNFNANFQKSDDFQVSFQYGAKYVKDTIDNTQYSGLTQLLGSEGRYDLSPRWDIGAWMSVLAALDAGTTDYGLGASLGYGLMENMWLSLGYNLRGFEDSDFSQGDFTARGPFVKFRFKFDQEDLRSLLK